MSEGIKIITENRKAFHNYSFEEKCEAGIILTGTEVKSLRDGKANLADSYAVFQKGELFLINAHIAVYAQGNLNNHAPLRTRKLLLHSHELDKLAGKIKIRGYSLIALKMYFKKGICKVELGLGKGKKSHDKREAEKEKDAKRSLAQLKKTARS